MRVLRGEDLGTLSRELGVIAVRLSEWRDALLANGKAGLKSRQPDARDEEIARLKETVGELTMDLEISREAANQLQERGSGPFGAAKVEVMSRAVTTSTGRPAPARCASQAYGAWQARQSPSGAFWLWPTAPSGGPKTA